ncbi:putative Hercynine oxygenase [Pillotina sp. SPG140]|jgi:formylglycine-generating enzyme required for sulfatase activity
MRFPTGGYYRVHGMKHFWITVLLLNSMGLIAQTVSLDEAIQATVRVVEQSLNQGTIVAPVDFYSSSERLSSYVLEEITNLLVNNKKVSVIHQQDIDLIRKRNTENGEALALGKGIGAQIILSGSLVDTGNQFRFRVHVTNGETGIRELSFSTNIAINDRQTLFLLTGVRIPEDTTVGTVESTTPEFAVVSTTPDNAVVSTVPENTGESTTPEYTVVSAAPDNISESTTPEFAVASTVPDNISESILPEFAVVSAAPDNTGESILPEFAVVSAAPDNSNESTTPEYTVVSAAPDNSNESILPEFAVVSTIPDNAVVSTVPEYIVESTVSGNGSESITPECANEEFALVQAGMYIMGSPITEMNRSDDEMNHGVVITRAFLMKKTEVTQKEWYDIIGTNPSNFRGDTLPVENISWFDALEYCNARSRKEGLNPVYTLNGTAVLWNRNANGYRLPTEAEWEYAARSGTAAPFSTGENISTDQANYSGDFPYNKNPSGNYRGKTTPVASFAPNAWGLYDMHGNVWEWCWDYYGEYDSAMQTDPATVSSGYFRVSRGGGWDCPAHLLRSARRNYWNPQDKLFTVGFRVVRTAEVPL